MGKADCPPSIHHFSHPHPLELQVAINIIVTCSGCKLNASNRFYTCKTCNYILHISCSKLPQQITHPADPNHTLSLLPVPAYEEGFFNCDACGRSGNGFSYHCKACNKDIHTLCAIKPLSINHHSHHHPLTLTFSPPYHNKGFSCDICHQVGLNHWLYRCNSCEFDAHLGCASIKPQPHSQAQIRTRTQTQTQTRPINQQTVQRSAIPQFVPSNMSNPNPNPNQGVLGVAVPNQRSVQQGNGLFRSQSQRAANIPSNMNNPNQVVFGAAGPNQRSVQGNGIFRSLSQGAAYRPSNMNNPNQVVFGAGGPNQRNGQQSGGIFNNLLQSAATGAAQQFGRSVVQDIMGGGGHGGGLFGGGGVTDFGGSLNGGLDFGGVCDFGGVDFGGMGDFSGTY